MPPAVCTSNVWLLIKLTPKSVVFSFLFVSFVFISFLFSSFLFFSFCSFLFLSPAMCRQHCPPPFSGSNSHSRTMVRHSRSSAGSVCLAVAVVISCTMVCRNSFLFSALVSTFRKVSLRERHMAQTRVPKTGSTGSALHSRDGGFRQMSRCPTRGLEPRVPFALRFPASAQMLACLKIDATPELYTLSDTVTYHCCIES